MKLANKVGHAGERLHPNANVTGRPTNDVGRDDVVLPTEAVDYRAKIVGAARDAGAAVLLISDDLDEVLTLGDRVAVIHAGRLGPARPAADWQREAIGLAMAGITGIPDAAQEAQV